MTQALNNGELTRLLAKQFPPELEVALNFFMDTMAENKSYEDKKIKEVEESLPVVDRKKFNDGSKVFGYIALLIEKQKAELLSQSQTP
jgi:hypothetical protein